MTTLQTVLTTATTATASGTLSAGQHTPVDATSGALTMTLPTPARAGARLRVEKVDSSANAVTVSGTIRGASSSLTLVGQYELIELVAESTSSWRPTAGHKTKAWLDAVYATLAAVPPGYQSYVQSQLTLVNQGALTLVPESGYVFALVDADGRIALGVQTDGTVVGKITVADGTITTAKLDATTQGMLPQGVPVESGYVETTVDADGRLGHWLTPDGSFGFAKLDAATIAYLTNALNLSGTVAPINYRTPKAVQHPITSGPDIVCWGDSLTRGNQSGDGVTYPAALQTLAGGNVRGRGVGGETSSGVAARQNGLPYLMLAAGGSIPTSGGVTVTFTTSGPGYDSTWPLLQGNGGIGGTGLPGTLAGVAGTLTLAQPGGASQTHQSSDVYTFTPTVSPGSPVTVNRPTPFYVTESESRRDDIALYWVGRNNLTDPQRVLSDVKAMIRHQTGLSRQYLVLSVLTGGGEGTGTTNYNNVAAINLALQQEFGRNYLDVRRYLIDYGLADAGITATSQDNTDVASDTVPSSLRFDSVHLIGAGYTVVAQRAYARLTELGII